MISVVLLGDQRPLRSTIGSRRVVLRDAINFQRRDVEETQQISIVEKVQN
jgi:hypothetical protein